MRRYPLALALAIALLPAAAHAEDLLQTYELARAGDPQLSAAEATQRATREGAVQARAALLPQLDGSASYDKSWNDSDGQQVFGGTPLPPSDSSSESTTRHGGKPPATT